MNKSDVERLSDLYLNVSKHSNYQCPPDALCASLGVSESQPFKYERERFECFSSELDFRDKKVLDIGANTGFFVFESLQQGADTVVAFEGNPQHSEFLVLARKVLEFEEQLRVFDSYYEFNKSSTNEVFDVCFLLNVLHHLGDDFGDSNLNVEQARVKILEALNSLSLITKNLVFQLGYCWKGNTETPLLSEGTKREQIGFITKGVADFWDIERIYVPEVKNGIVKYFPLNEKNIARNDKIGEFLNRPIYFLKSKMFLS